jgi:acetyltransferase
VALVGATERQGALGDIVFRNLAAGGLRGGLFPVNPKHARVHGQRAYSRLDRLPERPDLAVIATPGRTVPGIIDDAGALGIKAAIVLSSGFAEAGPAGVALQQEMLAAARRHGVRILGPNCLGAMRTDTGLNATFARKPARKGNLAVVSQSGAICGALLEWADRAGVGFTSVVSLGAAADVDFGEILDFLMADGSTEAVLLYVEGIRDARRYLSALRAAARVKPVIALKTGADAVFDAALRRAGTVRVKTYSQLFAAARAVASTLQPQGERLAILTNGGGPGVVAADSAAENGVPLAMLSRETISLLDEKLPPQWSHGNPVDIVGDATPERFAAATAALLADPGVDALLAMYSPVAVTEPEAAARAVARAVGSSKKPVLTAWLGDIDVTQRNDAIESQGIANFQTPESAVEAFSFLCAHRRNQAQLMEAPTARAADEPRPDLAKALALRDAALGQERRLLTQDEARELLVAFGLPVPQSIAAPTRAAAVAAAEKIGFPVVLKIHSPDITHKSDVGGVRLALQNADMVASAFDDTMRHVRALRPGARIDGVVLQPMLRFPHTREVLVGAATDPVFGPVVVFGAGGVSVDAVRDTALALPPLNAALARELMSRTRVHRVLAGYRDVPPADFEALARILCGVSRLLCALPWVKELDLNPVLAHPAGAVIADARVVLHGPEVRKLPAQGRRYPHLAIHPYPAELEGELPLKDGTRLPVRPMRPEDVELELAFFRGLSERSRYQRFMQQLSELPPRLLARFTQLDYDRELALVVLHEGRFVSVGRYAPNPDGTTAEFALTVADEWQGKGIGRALLERLCSSAREAGYAALYGNILADNRDMLHLAARLGFAETSRDGNEVVVVRRL